MPVTGLPAKWRSGALKLLQSSDAGAQALQVQQWCRTQGKLHR